MALDAQAIERKDLEYIQAEAREEFEVLAGSAVLFTGANGFLGYYFIKSILSWNDTYPDKRIKISALDTFPSGVPDWLASRDDVAILKQDITKYRPTESDNFDYIIHAASIASPTFYRQHPIETINANVLGLYNILEYTVNQKKTENPVRGLLFFSSSEIYGDPGEANIPTDETYRGNVSCTGPRACYDESKRFGETLCVNFSKVHEIPIKIVRPFNNYGPGLKISDGRVIPDLARDILSNRDITLLSEGSPTRTFCYITDAVVGYIKALIKGKSGESYNIGIEVPEISIVDLARKMKDISVANLEYKGEIITKTSDDKNYLTDSPNRRCPKIDKAKKELGYEPKVSLDEGLESTILWYQENNQ